MVTPWLEGIYALYLHVLLRTGALERLAAAPLLAALPDRPLVLAAALGAAFGLLYAALASGEAPAVRAFRAVAFLGAAGAAAVPFRFAGTPRRDAAGGALLLGVLLLGLVHRAQARLRRPGTAARAIAALRLVAEGVGLGLFGLSALLVARESPVPLRLAFWALFLLRLSVSDLLDPARLAAETGLSRSAARDVRAALATRGRKTAPARRARRAASGALKAVLVALWLAAPVAAALAPGEVAAGTWPPGARLLSLYPPLALVLTALLLLVEGARGLLTRPLEASRALVVAIATALYVAALYATPSFSAYRAGVPALVLVETAFGFLLGAAPRERVVA